MKAFVTPESGANTIEMVEVPVPQIDRNEVLVRVRAIGVGIHDSYFLPSDAEYPFPIGIEAAGIVDEVGAEVTTLRLGERIAFVSMMQPKGGTWAQFAAVRSDSLILTIPDEMDFTSAAALPVAGNTVLQALEVADVPDGGTLFVSGGAGAIGSLAIQLARSRGWRACASGSTHNFDYLRSLGAEKVVDYHDGDWPDQVLRWAPGGVDSAIAIHPGTSLETLKVVREAGSLVTVSADDVASERGIRVDTVHHQVDVRDELAQLVSDVATGRIHLEIEQIYSFDQAPQALARVQTRHARGKLVIRV